MAKCDVYDLHVTVCRQFPRPVDVFSLVICCTAGKIYVLEKIGFQGFKVFFMFLKILFLESALGNLQRRVENE